MNAGPQRRSFFNRLLTWMFNGVVGIVFVLGAITTLILVGIITAALNFNAHKINVKQTLTGKFNLAINLENNPVDAASTPFWLHFGQAPQPSLLQSVLAIDRAAHDDRVTGLDITLGSGCCSLTTAEELHNAIARFRAESGKPVIARAMSFDGATGLGAYIVATAASRIELSEAGDFGVTGLSLQTPFAATALQTIGVDAQFEHVGQYKTYPQLYTRSAPSKANLHMLNSLAGSLYRSAIAPIAVRLNQPPAAVRAMIDQAPFSAEQAKQDGLIDAVLPLDAEISVFAGRTVSFSRYVADAPKPPDHATHIALIIAHGDIQAPSAGDTESAIAPRQLAAELHHAIHDKDIKAILLRLDTPGGTVTGSAVIGAQVAAAARAHKPLIISMGGLDASGGYWVSSHGAVLVADPATLTGSIGVLGGKLSFGKLLSKIGVTIAGASRGANADFDGQTTRWNQAELANLQTMLNQDYQNFVGWVAAGRHMTPAAVNTIGQGRVWTGTQALKRGLVDKIGGYHTAFAAVRTALHLAPNAPLAINNGKPNFKALLKQLLHRDIGKLNPLGLASLPPRLRSDAQMITTLSQLHRLEMPPMTIR